MAKQINKKKMIHDALNKTFNDPKFIIGKYIKLFDEHEELRKLVGHKRLNQKLERW